MSEIWLTIPSARPHLEAGPVIQRWKSQGYKIALWRERDDEVNRMADFSVALPYPGYAKAVNALVQNVMGLSPQADWMVAGGDDIFPEPNFTAQELAAQMTEHFPDLFGVCQFTGDRWGDDPFSRARWPDAPAYADRILGSPWMGREYCRRAHGGLGPFHPDFFHMHVDESAFEYCKMLGILWQRRDLIHYHDHWGRKEDASPADCPDFLKPVSVGIEGQKHWEESKAILDRLKAERFASCLPIA